MSHASATPVTPHSARITETAPARSLLVVETLDHTAGSTTQFTYGTHAAPTGTAQLTYCVQASPTGTLTYCVQAAPTGTAQLTFCVQASPTDAFAAQGVAPSTAEGDAVAESWI